MKQNELISKVAVLRILHDTFREVRHNVNRYMDAVKCDCWMCENDVDCVARMEYDEIRNAIQHVLQLESPYIDKDMVLEPGIWRFYNNPCDRVECSICGGSPGWREDDWKVCPICGTRMENWTDFDIGIRRPRATGIIVEEHRWPNTN